MAAEPVTAVDVAEEPVGVTDVAGEAEPPGRRADRVAAPAVP